MCCYAISSLGKHHTVFFHKLGWHGLLFAHQAIWHSLLLTGYKPVEQVTTKNMRLNQAQGKLMQSRDLVKLCEAAPGVTLHTVL